MGGYHDDRDFDGLELSAYQRLFLNGGPFPTEEGQVGIVAGTGVGGGTVINWTNCLRTHDWVREEWATEHGLEGLDQPEYDAHMDAVWERLRRERRLLRPLGSPSPAPGGLREARLRLPHDHPQHRSRALRPGLGGLHGLRRPVGLEELDREDVPARRPARRARRSSPTAGPSGSWSRTAARPGSRPSTPIPSPAQRRRASTRVVVRAPVVVVACGSLESPGACCCARRSAARRPATTCACIRRRRSPPSTRSRRTGSGARRRRRSRTSSPTSATATGSCSRRRSRPPG